MHRRDVVPIRLLLDIPGAGLDEFRVTTKSDPAAQWTLHEPICVPDGDPVTTDWSGDEQVKLCSCLTVHVRRTPWVHVLRATAELHHLHHVMRQLLHQPRLRLRPDVGVCAQVVELMSALETIDSTQKDPDPTIPSADMGSLSMLARALHDDPSMGTCTAEDVTALHAADAQLRASHEDLVTKFATFTTSWDYTRHWSRRARRHAGRAVIVADRRLVALAHLRTKAQQNTGFVGEPMGRVKALAALAGTPRVVVAKVPAGWSTTDQVAFIVPEYVAREVAPRNHWLLPVGATVESVEVALHAANHAADLSRFGDLLNAAAMATS